MVVGGESPARWREAASRCSLPQGRGPRAASRRAGRAIEDGATTGEDEEGARRSFPSRVERAESPGVGIDEEVGAGEGGGGAGPPARANDAGASAEKNGDGGTTMRRCAAKDGDGGTRIGEVDVDAVVAEAIEMRT